MFVKVLLTYANGDIGVGKGGAGGAETPPNFKSRG